MRREQSESSASNGTCNCRHIYTLSHLSAAVFGSAVVGGERCSSGFHRHVVPVTDFANIVVSIIRHLPLLLAHFAEFILALDRCVTGENIICSRSKITILFRRVLICY